MLDILTVFGGTTLYIPDDWTVKIDVVSILGGFSDSRTSQAGPPQEIKKELIVRGTVILGGGEIKKV